MTGRGMSPRLVADVAREIDARRGARVRSAHEDGKLAFRLDVRGEQREDLVIALGPPFPRIYLAAPRPAPKTPSALAGTLRRLLKGAQIVAARAIDGERALCVTLRRGDDDAELWIELFGGQANLYVVGADGCVQMTPRGDVAKRRSASKGMVFEPVPPRELTADEMQEDDEHTGSAAVRALTASAGTTRDTGSAQARLRRFVKRKLRAAEKARTQLETALAREADADDLHKQGELLRGAFHLVRPGLTHVQVPDYTEDPPVDIEIELDPDLPPGQQVAACFRKERKLRRAAEAARERLSGSAATVEALTSAQQQLAEAQFAEDLDAEVLPAIVAALPTDLQAEAARELDVPAQGKAAKPSGRALPWHTFLSADGWRILVGRDARGNDELTLKHAGAGDLFLHVRGATGSHVIVPTPRGKTVPRDTLLDAAELACHFSERRAAEHNEVEYTPRRYVRKPRGVPAGLVRVERSKTLGLRKDESRRARLLAARIRPGDPGGAA
jgi:predicted ribosome quality control (RQC) complex YloA/Tae2 family protein